MCQQHKDQYGIRVKFVGFEAEGRVRWGLEQRLMPHGGGDRYHAVPAKLPGIKMGPVLSNYLRFPKKWKSALNCL